MTLYAVSYLILVRLTHLSDVGTCRDLRRIFRHRMTDHFELYAFVYTNAALKTQKLFICAHLVSFWAAFIRET